MSCAVPVTIIRYTFQQFLSYSFTSFPSGTLSGVIDLTGVQNSQEEIVFHWSAPFSLLGVPILGYAVLVDIASGLEGNVLSSVMEYVTETNFTVSKPESINCTYVNLTVYANNSVGLGDSVGCIAYFTESE